MGLPPCVQSWRSTRIVPSCEHETIRCPSRANPTDMTEYLCPVNGPATVCPVVAFHTRIVPSSEPETIRWPSGENPTDVTESVCPVCYDSDTFHFFSSHDSFTLHVPSPMTHSGRAKHDSLLTGTY